MAVQEPVFTMMRIDVASVPISKMQVATDLRETLDDFVQSMKQEPGMKLFVKLKSIEAWESSYLSLVAEWIKGQYAFDAIPQFREFSASLRKTGPLADSEYATHVQLLETVQRLKRAPPPFPSLAEAELIIGLLGAEAQGPSSLLQRTVDWNVTCAGYNGHGDINPYSSLFLELIVVPPGHSNYSEIRFSEWDPLTQSQKEDLQLAKRHVQPVLDYLVSKDFVLLPTEAITYNYNRAICTCPDPFFILEKKIDRFTEADVGALLVGVNPHLPKPPVKAFLSLSVYVRQGSDMVERMPYIRLPRDYGLLLKGRELRAVI